ncbi:thiol reductant ABC exporter subunit CydC [Streptomyces sp. NPDC006879]|uniref:thiol reductant ABC exporter subunit CydC n=1 Tax=Streptomyces sp. NPDC006879 TaxID=3364767 RepID=UPI0036BB2D78
MRALLAVLRAAGPGHKIVTAVLLALAADLGAVTLMGVAAWLIARAAEHPLMGALSVAIVAVRALAVTRGLFRYGERLAGHDAALRAVATLRRRVFGALAARPARLDAPALRDADTASRLVADVDLVQDALLRVAIPACSALLVCVGAVTAAACVSMPAALALALGLAAAGLLLPMATARSARRAGLRAGALRAELAVRAVDILDGAADLRAFGAAEQETTRAADTARRLRAHDRGTALMSALSAAVLTVLQGATVLAVAVVCAGEVPRVWAVALPLLALASFEPLAPLPAAAQLLSPLTESARRVAELLDPSAPPGFEPQSSRSADPARVRGTVRGPLPAARRGPDPAVLRAGGRLAPAGWKAASGATPSPDAAPAHLTVRDLRVRYRPDAPPALRGVDLDLPPGRRIALVGASGSGKSTLLAALTRLVVPYQGHVLLGGQDLAGVPEATLRRTVSGSLQDAHVFHTSIRNNLLPARPGASDAALLEALGRAGLAEWVRALPEGLDTYTGSDGERLSGGQRRRLLLARALLAAPPVLLLDEPTEGLDPATADAVLHDVTAGAEETGASLVLVTHRLRGLAELPGLDEVLVMADGRLVQRLAPADFDRSRPLYGAQAPARRAGSPPLPSRLEPHATAPRQTDADDVYARSPR